MPTAPTPPGTDVVRDPVVVPPSRRGDRLLLGLELVTSLSALCGGLLLVLRPDGSLLDADPEALTQSPFHSWLVPGLLLMTLVGGGFAVAALCQWRAAAFARELSMVAGFGLIVFVLAEFIWLGFQPLETAFAGVGALVVWLAGRAAA